MEARVPPSALCAQSAAELDQLRPVEKAAQQKLEPGEVAQPPGQAQLEEPL